jgi:hypothetical protein
MRSPLTRAGSAAISVLSVLLFGLVPGAQGGTVDARGAIAHRWVVYSGRDDGLRIVFEVNGRRLTQAYVSVPLVCIREGRRRHGRFEEVQGRDSAILVNPQGRFHEHERRENPVVFESRKIVGQVTPRTIEGKIAVSSIQRYRFGNEECHSGKSLEGPLEVLSFRANRRRIG